MSIPHDCECSECEDLRAELARLQAEPMHKLLSRMKERAEKAESLLAKCGEALGKRCECCSWTDGEKPSVGHRPECHQAKALALIAGGKEKP